jgi:pimeloyl-ACP methyl ester carboxylesterase
MFTLCRVMMLCRVMIWQGEDDLSVPVKHAQWWARRLPRAKLTVLPGEGHVTVLLRHGQSILHSALHWTPQEAPGGEKQQERRKDLEAAEQSQAPALDSTDSVNATTVVT